MVDEAKYLKLLASATYEAYGQALGNQNKLRERQYTWFHDIHPGMLVMESSTIHMRERDRTRFGYVIRIGQEPMHTDEEWETEKENWDPERDGRPEHLVHRIRLLTDDSEYGWHNAGFLRVPTETMGVF